MFAELSLRHNLWLFFGAMFTVAFIGLWKGRKESDPINAAYVRFKYVTIGYAILLYGLLLNLPSTFVDTLTRPEELESIETLRSHYMRLASVVNGIKEMVWWFVFMTIAWIGSLIGFVRIAVIEWKKRPS